MAFSNHAILFGDSGRHGYAPAASARTRARLQRELLQFGRSVMTCVWTWVAVPITIWALLPSDLQRKLTGNYWPSSIDNEWMLLLGFALLTLSCFRAWDAARRFVEQAAASPCFELQINQIDIGSLPGGCELAAHITIRNRGSDSQATDWLLRGSDHKSMSLITGEAIQVKFEPMGGDLTDSPVQRSQTRRGIVTFIAHGITAEQAQQIAYWFLACRDDLKVCHESAAQYV